MPCWSEWHWRNITAQHDDAKRKVAHHYKARRSTAEHCDWWRCPVSGTEYSFQYFSHLNIHFNWMLGIFCYSPVIETMHPTWRRRQNVKHGTIHVQYRRIWLNSVFVGKTCIFSSRISVPSKHWCGFAGLRGLKHDRCQENDNCASFFLHIPSPTLIFLFLYNNIENFGIWAINCTFLQL